MDHTLFIHSSIDGHLGCFYFWVVVSDADMNLGVQASVQDRALVMGARGQGVEGRVTRAAGLQWGLCLLQSDLPLA